MNIKDLHITGSDLYEMGFHLDRQSSNRDTSIYVKVFPVWKYNEIPVLLSRIIVSFPSKDVMIDVYDTNGQIYAPFYAPSDHSSHKNMLRKINRIIKREMNFKKL